LLQPRKTTPGVEGPEVLHPATSVRKVRNRSRNSLGGETRKKKRHVRLEAGKRKVSDPTRNKPARGEDADLKFAGKRQREVVDEAVDWKKRTWEKEPSIGARRKEKTRKAHPGAVGERGGEKKTWRTLKSPVENISGERKQKRSKWRGGKKVSPKKTKKKNDQGRSCQKTPSTLRPLGVWGVCA